jgi:ABC-type sugar transport system substrate-binding protein
MRAGLWACAAALAAFTRAGAAMAASPEPVCVSLLDADAAFRAQEAQFAEGWFRTITHEVFG